MKEIGLKSKEWVKTLPSVEFLTSTINGLDNRVVHNISYTKRELTIIKDALVNLIVNNNNDQILHEEVVELMNDISEQL